MSWKTNELACNLNRECKHHFMYGEIMCIKTLWTCVLKIFRANNFPVPEQNQCAFATWVYYFYLIFGIKNRSVKIDVMSECSFYDIKIIELSYRYYFCLIHLYANSAFSQNEILVAQSECCKIRYRQWPAHWKVINTVVYTKNFFNYTEGRRKMFYYSHKVSLAYRNSNFQQTTKPCKL